LDVKDSQIIEAVIKLCCEIRINRPNMSALLTILKCLHQEIVKVQDNVDWIDLDLKKPVTYIIISYVKVLIFTSQIRQSVVERLVMFSKPPGKLNMVIGKSQLKEFEQLINKWILKER